WRKSRTGGNNNGRQGDRRRGGRDHGGCPRFGRRLRRWNLRGDGSRGSGLWHDGLAEFLQRRRFECDQAVTLTLQLFQMLNRGVEKFVVRVWHRITLETLPRRCTRNLFTSHSQNEEHGS